MKRDKLKVLQKVFGPSHKTGQEFLFFCPQCDHHKRKLSVNIEKDAWKCWICNNAGYKLGRLIRKWGTYEDKTTWAKYDNEIEISNFEEEFLNFFQDNKVNLSENKLFLPPEFKTLATNKITIESLEVRRYLKDRNVSKEDIFKWKIGYCNEGEYRKRVVVPSFGLDGYVNYFVARTYRDDWMVYKNPPTSKDIVFNHLYVDWTQDIILVEGVFDAIRVGGNSVPILGSTLGERSKLFNAIVKHDTPIYLALDKDAEAKSLKMISSLLEYGVEVYKIDTSGYRDVGEMPASDFHQRKLAAIQMSSDAMVLYQALYA